VENRNESSVSLVGKCKILTDVLKITCYYDMLKIPSLKPILYKCLEILNFISEFPKDELSNNTLEEITKLIEVIFCQEQELENFI